MADSPGNGSTSSTSCAPRSPEPAPGRRLHGRRAGRPLTARRRRLIDELLPAVALEVPAHGTIDARAAFATPPDEVWLEVGFGKGEHLAHQAARHRAVGLIGCEPFLGGVASLLAAIEDGGLANVRVFAGDARLLLDRLAESSLDRAFVLFPDPWPKARHRKRRFLDRAALDGLARALVDGGRLRFATDDADYLTDTLALVLAHRDFAWPAEAAAEWHRPADQGPRSRCEAKALREGRRPVYLAFTRVARGLRPCRRPAGDRGPDSAPRAPDRPGRP